MEASFNPHVHNLSRSLETYDGSANSCSYVKDILNSQGIVYVMSGSASGLGIMKPSFPHDAMPFANDTIGGAVMLEIEENRQSATLTASYVGNY